MSEKKNILPALSLVCAVLALILSVISLLPGREPVCDHSALEQQVQDLQTQVAMLTAQLEVMDGSAGLADWTLSAASWDDGTGADVTLSAVPELARDDTTLTFRVSLEGSEVASQVCTAENGIFTATVSLPAAEGYRYDCILSDGSGSRSFLLSGPEDPVVYDLVYLQSSLNAYCSLHIESWEPEGTEALVLTDAVGHVQLPLIATENELTIQTAELILALNSEEVSRVPLQAIASEEPDLLLLPAGGVRFDLPEMSGEDVLELTLAVTLSDGRTLTAFGANWYQASGELYLVVG